MTDYRIYVIDDETVIRESIAMALADVYRIETFDAAEPAISAMETKPPDLVLLDIGLPGMDGIQALEEMQRRHPGLLTVMITAFEDLDTVIAAMRRGAYDYVVKPLRMDGLEATIRNALETIRLRKEVRSLQQQVLKDNIPCFIAHSDVIQDVMVFVGQVAQSPDTPVLIQGETGTGKELIASAIHYQSPNFQGPFLTINCAAIPTDLVESELFGYEKGAYSGAGAAGKRGLLEAAGGGTLFLDEVGDLSPNAQAKLLRFLEQGEFYRVGGTRKQIIETRVISATNKDLDLMIADGRFRKDLYFRLGVVKVKIPALNARTADILPLARHFLMEFADKFGKPVTGFTPAAEKALVAHRWTGNVRELKNVIERGMLVGSQPLLTPEDLELDRPAGKPAADAADAPAPFAPIPPEGMDLTALEKAMERFYLEAALKMAGGNESRAARLLHLNHHTFRYRRKKYLAAPP
ncbi:acetoacetate metabolism regulatory protein AtoC [Desulfosarcina alkanivorans]|uniref:DNA-binding transcriptional regulator NtrC n=1 Tax=Desulfosarcina alkanivorans TaxID=571177 RepID=A0A5K7YM74_9BACT|nr:sigma-54 dependent transcriptional regulator [Desulfosarcina alkanivorans]BBO70842.1 acetoacetate metabolism regulatory protein AtoC [Desulfosarcina alkanivorans]